MEKVRSNSPKLPFPGTMKKVRSTSPALFKQVIGSGGGKEKEEEGSLPALAPKTAGTSSSKDQGSGSASQEKEDGKEKYKSNPTKLSLKSSARSRTSPLTTSANANASSTLPSPSLAGDSVMNLTAPMAMGRKIRSMSPAILARGIYNHHRDGPKATSGSTSISAESSAAETPDSVGKPASSKTPSKKTASSGGRRSIGKVTLPYRDRGGRGDRSARSTPTRSFAKERRGVSPILFDKLLHKATARSSAPEAPAADAPAARIEPHQPDDNLSTDAVNTVATDNLISKGEELLGPMPMPKTKCVVVDEGSCDDTAVELSIDEGREGEDLDSLMPAILGRAVSEEEEARDDALVSKISVETTDLMNQAQELLGTAIAGK